MDLMTISGKINILNIIKQTDFYEDAGVGGGGLIGSKHAIPTICTVSSQRGDFGR